MAKNKPRPFYTSKKTEYVTSKKLNNYTTTG